MILLTTEETAELLKVNVETVRRMVRRGEVPHVRVGRRIRIPREELVGRLSAASGAGRSVATGAVPTVLREGSEIAGQRERPHTHDAVKDELEGVRSLVALPGSAVETGIRDLATNIDHHLYGHPKARDER